jgi:hypothetical protein
MSFPSDYKPMVTWEDTNIQQFSSYVKFLGMQLVKISVMHSDEINGQKTKLDSNIELKTWSATYIEITMETKKSIIG